eukprot:1246891-Amphidinium_carterae.1
MKQSRRVGVRNSEFDNARRELDSLCTREELCEAKRLGNRRHGKVSSLIGVREMHTHTVPVHSFVCADVASKQRRISSGEAVSSALAVPEARGGLDKWGNKREIVQNTHTQGSFNIYVCGESVLSGCLGAR